MAIMSITATTTTMAIAAGLESLLPVEWEVVWLIFDFLLKGSIKVDTGSTMKGAMLNGSGCVTLIPRSRILSAMSADAIVRSRRHQVRVKEFDGKDLDASGIENGSCRYYVCAVSRQVCSLAWCDLKSKLGALNMAKWSGFHENQPGCLQVPKSFKLKQVDKISLAAVETHIKCRSESFHGMQPSLAGCVGRLKIGGRAADLRRNDWVLASRC